MGPQTQTSQKQKALFHLDLRPGTCEWTAVGKVLRRSLLVLASFGGKAPPLEEEGQKLL